MKTELQDCLVEYNYNQWFRMSVINVIPTYSPIYKKKIIEHIKHPNFRKLDGVGPVYNRPSTD